MDTAAAVHNSIIDGKLLKLSNETIPLTAISSIRVTREPVRLMAMIQGGIGIYGLSWVGMLIGVIGGYYFWVGLQTILNPQFFLYFTLHSGRQVRLKMASEQEARQAEQVMQSALLGTPILIDVTPSPAPEPAPQMAPAPQARMQPRLGYR